MQSISCVTMSATYHATIDYTDSTQSVTVVTSDESPLNASLLAPSDLFYGILQSKPWYNPIQYPTQGYVSYPPRSEDEISTIYRGMQLRAMRDTLVRAISGGISGFGKFDYSSPPHARLTHQSSLCRRLLFRKHHHSTDAVRYSTIHQLKSRIHRHSFQPVALYHGRSHEEHHHLDAQQREQQHGDSGHVPDL